MDSSRGRLSNASLVVSSLLLPLSGAFHDLFLLGGLDIDSSVLAAMLRNKPAIKLTWEGARALFIILRKGCRFIYGR